MPKEPELETSDSAPDSDEADEAGEAKNAATDESASDQAPRRPRKGTVEAAARRAKRKRAKQKPVLPRTEAEIDSPKPLTLWMLGVMSAATLIMWGTARFACNQQGAIAKEPATLPTEKLASTPKDAAIELQQRWATYDFARAQDLAKGAAGQQLAKDRQSCERDSASCQRKKQELADRVATSAALLRREPTSAVVRVTSVGTDTGKQVWLMDLEQDGAIWKATTRRADEPVAPGPEPAPEAPPQGMAPQGAPAQPAGH
jgi:hypothetical protein